MNNDHFNQLKQFLTSVDTRLSSLERGQKQLGKGQDEIRERVLSVEVQGQAHAQKSKKEHDGIFSLILDTTEVNDEAYKKKFSNHEKRISVIERQINSA